MTTTNVDRARSLTEACDLLNSHARGTMDGATDAALDEAAAFLRSRLAAWELGAAERWAQGMADTPPLYAAMTAYDEAMRSLCAAALALHDAAKEDDQ